MSGRGSYVDGVPLGNVTVLGVQSVGDVAFNNVSLGSGWAYDETAKVLSVTGLTNITRSGAWTSDWSLSWA